MLAMTRVSMRGWSVRLIPHLRVHWPGHIRVSTNEDGTWVPPAAHSAVISLTYLLDPMEPQVCATIRDRHVQYQGVAPNFKYKDSSGEDIFECGFLRPRPIDSAEAELETGL